MTKLEPNQLKLGMTFSKPVFFEDGENMFLAENKEVTQVLLDVIKNWKVPFLLTDGEENTGKVEENVPEIEELEPIDE